MIPENSNVKLPKLQDDNSQGGAAADGHDPDLKPGQRDPYKSDSTVHPPASQSSSVTRNASHSSSMTRPHRKGSGTSTGGEKKVHDETMIARYVALIAQSLHEQDPTYKPPTVPGMLVSKPVASTSRGGIPDASANRSQKRRIMQLEDMLKTLPSFKEKPNEITPTQVLACSYLRLSKNNIADCETAIKDQGNDPGVHVHMTQEQAEEYFHIKDKLDALRKIEGKDDDDDDSKEPSDNKHNAEQRRGAADVV